MEITSIFTGGFLFPIRSVSSALAAALVPATNRPYILWMVQHKTRAGTVAILGMPNAGKSSLLNRLMGAKLSIVTPFAQTTRERVVGIDTRDAVQMIFLDTPGIVDPAYLLHHSLVTIIEETVAEADVAVLVLDGTRPPPVLSAPLAATLARLAPRLLVVVNKSDIAADTQQSGLHAWSADHFATDPLSLSALTGEGIEPLRARVGGLLPESPFLYPEDEISSQPVRFFVAELVRETVFERYSEEIPYSVAVRIQEFREAEDPIFIRAEIMVERPTQKAILIGKGGAAIRELGTAARLKIESFLEQHVYLDLWVKVVPKWRKNAVELRRLGFSVPDEKDR